MTQQEIADRLGVSKVAVCKEFRRRGWRRVVNASTAPPTSKPKSPKSAKPQRVVDPAELPAAVATTLLQSDIWLLEITERELRRIHTDPGIAVGASSLKAAAATLDMLRSNLTAAGILAAPEDNRPTEMVIRVLTPEEESEIRRQVESTEISGGGQDNVAGLAEGAAPSSPSPLAAVEVAPDPAAPEHGALIRDPLPRPGDYRAWLHSLIARRGRLVARQIVEALGGGHSHDHSPSSLVDRIFRLTGGDPTRLKGLS